MLSTSKKGFLEALRRVIMYFFGSFTGGGLQLIDQAVTKDRVKRNDCSHLCT